MRSAGRGGGWQTAPVAREDDQSGSAPKAVRPPWIAADGTTEIAERSRRVGGFLLDQLGSSFVVSLLTFVALSLLDGPDTDGAARDLAFVSAWIVAMIVYYVVPVARTGRTIGKAILRMRVVTHADDALLTWRASAVRAVVSTGPLLVPFTVRQLEPAEVVSAVVWITSTLVWIGVHAVAFRSDELRGLHDEAAGAVVLVDERRGRFVMPDPYRDVGSQAERRI